MSDLNMLKYEALLGSMFVFKGLLCLILIVGQTVMYNKISKRLSIELFIKIVIYRLACIKRAYQKNF